MNLNIATPSTRHRIAIKLEKNMVVRTIPNTWVNTTENIIIPISIHSAIHDDIDGYFKFCSMINVIKSKSAGKIIVLLSEGAHVNVINLQHQNNISQTLHLCRQDAEKLYQRYQSIFTGCEVTYWQDFIMRHANYKNYKNAIYSQIISNEAFKVSILNDLEKGYSELTVLDISQEALGKSKERLGDKANRITWVEADVLKIDFPENSFDLWHDRAVFHFLTKAEERKAYLEVLKKALKSGGFVIISSFSLEGPLKCSGLDVVRCSSETLSSELGNGFSLIKSSDERHKTPFNSFQNFVYVLFRKN